MAFGITKIHIILLLAVILFFNCSSEKNRTTKKVIGTNSENFDLPDSEIYHFSYKYTRHDKVVWELFSDVGDIYKNKDLIKIKKVNLVFYKGGRQDTKVTSKFGEIIQSQKILTAISNVVLETADKTILYTELLHWNDGTQKLYTDQFVKIIKPTGDIITGIGMEADNNLEKIIIKRRVSGKIYEKKH